jgi:hypothetical protein
MHCVASSLLCFYRAPIAGPPPWPWPWHLDHPEAEVWEPMRLEKAARARCDPGDTGQAAGHAFQAATSLEQQRTKSNLSESLSESRQVCLLLSWT